MQTLDSRAGLGSRRFRWLAALAAVPLAAAAGVAVWSLVGGGGDDEDPLTIATELADTWVRAFHERDPGLAMSILTDEGIYINDDGDALAGEDTRDDVAFHAGMMNNVERVDGVEKVSEDNYVFTAEFDVSGFGRRSRAVLEMELDGDLASRLEMVEYGSVE